MEKISIINSYGDTLRGNKWTIDNPKANIILTTGLCEYSSRYDRFAKLLNENGYNVFCLDHYGQGENVEGDTSKLGIEPKDSLDKIVDTLYQLRGELLKKYKNIPVYNVAHSMGSFVLQELIQKYPDATKKAVLIGTAGPQAKVLPGYYFLRCLVNKRNWNKPSKFAESLTTGVYAKTVKNRKYECEWISFNEDNFIKYNSDKFCNYRRSWGAQLNLTKGLKNLHKKKRMKKINQECDILICVGDKDPVSNNAKTAYKLFNLYKKLGHEKVTLKIFENMRHEVLNEKNHKLVDEVIIDFLNK